MTDIVMAEASARRSPGYREIADLLIADIRAGAWQVGGQLPPESALVDRFGASRNTIRESLRILDSLGYIKRRRGTRSLLVSADPSDRFVNSVQSIGELLQYSQRTSSRLISVDLIVATGALAERLGVAVGSQWLRAQVLRIPKRSDTPIGFSEIFIAGRYAAVAERLDQGGPVYQQLEAMFDLNFARVEQSIEAAPESVSAATFLGVAEGSPLLAVRTDFVTAAGEVAEIGFGHFPAHRYRIEIMLERDAHRSTPEDD